MAEIIMKKPKPDKPNEYRVSSQQRLDEVESSQKEKIEKLCVQGGLRRPQLSYEVSQTWQGDTSSKPVHNTRVKIEKFPVLKERCEPLSSHEMSEEAMYAALLVASLPLKFTFVVVAASGVLVCMQHFHHQSPRYRLNTGLGEVVGKAKESQQKFF